MRDKIILSLITFVSGIFIKGIWDKFKKRIICLRYTVWHQYLGASVDDTRFGSLKLLYNNTPLKSLYMSNVKLINESEKDLSALEVNIVCDQGSAILVSYGKNRASLKELKFTDEYNKVLLNQNPDNMGHIFERRDYKIPVLNRGGKVDFSLLTTNLKGLQPRLSVSCDYPGAKMKYGNVLPELFGEPQAKSALLGSLAALLLCIPIVIFIESKAIAVFIAGLICLFAVLLGIILRKLCKLLIKIIS